MKQKLTARQMAVLNFVVRFIKKRGYTPSYDDMEEGLCIRRNAILQHIKAIERKGWISRIPNAHRGLRVV